MVTAVKQSPAFKAFSEYFTVVWKIGALCFAIFVLWLGRWASENVFSKEEGDKLVMQTQQIKTQVDKLPEKLYTRTEGAALENDLDLMKKSQSNLVTEIYGIKIEQRYTNQQLAEIKDILKSISTNKQNP